MTPSLRRPLGVIAICAGLTAYVLIVVALLAPVASLHPLLQLPIWAVLGVVWVVPLKPVIYWIETGKWTH